jgi:hypothetical protein
MLRHRPLLERHAGLPPSVVGFLPARELPPNLWPNHKALLLAMPLDDPRPNPHR